MTGIPTGLYCSGEVRQEVTKERILDAAEELMIERSFHSVGLSQILAAVKVSKGAFYHHFDSKEQFGVEMLRHYASSADARKKAMLLDSGVESNPVERLLSFFKALSEATQESGYKAPCLLHKLACEVSDFSEPMREEVAKGFSETISVISQTLDEAVAQNLLLAAGDTTADAAFILDLWNGALQRALIDRSAKPLEDAISRIRLYLENPT